VTGWWFSLGTVESSTNKTDHHVMAEILLNMALNTITLLMEINVLSTDCYIIIKRDIHGTTFLISNLYLLY